MSTGVGLSKNPSRLSHRLRYVPYALDAWCPVLRSNEIGVGERTSTQVLGQELVVFRGKDGTIRALEDRCPHHGIELSLGEVRGNNLQCAYHGWTVDGEGHVCSIPGIEKVENAPSAKSWKVKELGGLIWAFIGDSEQSTHQTLPDITPYDSSGLLIRLEIDAHWSFVLDNGLDLFHQHLHRGVPYFFRINALDDFGSVDDSFAVRYRATLRNVFNRPHPGNISIRVKHNVATLEFEGIATIHGIATPRSSDGRHLTMWWMIAIDTGRFIRKFILPLLKPFIRSKIELGFRQDARVLASEHAAFVRDPERYQYEVNPVIAAMHGYMENYIVQRAVDGANRVQSAQDVRADFLIDKARKGDIAVLATRADKIVILEPTELEEIIKDSPTVRVGGYGHILFLVTKDLERFRLQ